MDRHGSQKKKILVVTVLAAAVVLPLGVFFYFRMVRFRLRLYKDLRTICENNERVTQQIDMIVKLRNNYQK